jgi:hypothetical protein
MWVLVLAIASFLGFVSIVLLLSLADDLGQRNRPPAQQLYIAEPFTSLFSVLAVLDAIFTALWDAQIRALGLIRAAMARATPVSQLRSTISETASRQWLESLEDIKLIKWVSQRALLTREGRKFLEHRFTTNALLQR